MFDKFYIFSCSLKSVYTVFLVDVLNDYIFEDSNGMNNELKKRWERSTVNITEGTISCITRSMLDTQVHVSSL